MVECQRNGISPVVVISLRKNLGRKEAGVRSYEVWKTTVVSSKAINDEIRIKSQSVSFEYRNLHRKVLSRDGENDGFPTVTGIIPL